MTILYTSSMDHQPSFEQIIGGTQEEQDALRIKAAKATERGIEEKYEQYIVERTPPEDAAIKSAVSYTSEVARQYGSTKQVDEKRIFLLKPGAIQEVSKNNMRKGFYEPFNQIIAVDRYESIAVLAVRVAHELFHMHSYHSAQIFQDTNSAIYRSGIGMLGREQEWAYFSFAEEAIIATLSKRFFDEVICHDPLYEEDIRYTGLIKDWMINNLKKAELPEDKMSSRMSFIQEILIFPNGKSMFEVLIDQEKEFAIKLGYFSDRYEKELKQGNIMRERRKEREAFSVVLDRIIHQSKGAITNKEILFDAFARAHFTGNYIPLARLIDGALGKGSFRAIATELGEKYD